jgi:hypothetical protein
MSAANEDRRQEPRFATRGVLSFSIAGNEFQSDIADLSLNGLKVSRPGGFNPVRGDRFRVAITIIGADRFLAEVMLVFIDDQQLGLEFYDMPPRDFGVLAGLIEHFRRAQTPRMPAASA